MADRKKPVKCSCGHAEKSHRWEDGFYDVRGHRAECTVVGCPCRRFDP